MRVVGFQHDVVDADPVALDERRLVLDRAEPEVADQHLRGGQALAERLPGAVHRVIAEHVVEAVEQSCHPTDSAFGQTDLQVGEPAGQPRVQPVDRRGDGVGEKQHALHVRRRVRGGGRRRPGRSDVQVDHGAGLGARGHHRIPVVGVDARQAEHRRVLAERHGVKAAVGVLVDHLRAELGGEQPRQLAGNNAVGVRARPDVEMPVVPGADAGQREVAIGGHLLQPLPGEAGQKRGEVERGVDTVEVHILDALVDIPCAPAHLVESHGFEAVLRHRPPDHRVEADVGQFPAVVHPGLAPGVGVDDFGRPVGELSGQPAGEGVGGFDDVVVDRDDGVAASRPGRIGQEGDRPFGAGLGRGEVQVGGQLVDRFHASNSSRWREQTQKHPTRRVRGCFCVCSRVR